MSSHSNTPLALNTPKPITVKFDDDKVTNMLTLLRSSPFPSAPTIPTEVSQKWELGIELDFIAPVKAKFETTFDARALEGRVNKYQNYTVKMRESVEESGKEVDVDVHYVHAKSERVDAIPLLMVHGWPGTFLDFHKIIEPLINPPAGQQAFHIITPSLPGFVFSSQPQTAGWTLEHTARVFHRLVQHVLGYERYAVHGGDWGFVVIRLIAHLFPEHAPAVHFAMFPVREGAVDPNPTTVSEERTLARRREFFSKGNAYFQMQASKPFTIGHAIASSPLAMLIWIGEKFHEWSDPRYLDTDDLIDTVALYYLSGSFASSVLVYNQNAPILKKIHGDVDGLLIRSKIGYSAFPYEIIGATRAEINAVGPLVYYKERERGGHFAALDNPEGLVEDLREFFGAHYPRV